MSASNQSKKSKKKMKYVDLNVIGNSPDAIRLPGRHKCDCDASAHPLINNCLACGRIVCEQEGSGPCMFCGQLVCTSREEGILNGKPSKQSRELREKLMGSSSTESLSLATISKQFQLAVDQKNKLLLNDADSGQRTKVYDDQSDYYSYEDNQFLSPDQRAAIRARREQILAQKFGSRLDKPIMVDFDLTSRRVVQSKSDEIDIANDPEIQSILEASMTTASTAPEQRVVHAKLKLDAPMYLETTTLNHTVTNPPPGSGLPSGRVQNADFAQMEVDRRGRCLSIRQPYASLLVCGIKKNEGREWYTNHRGRLWIASTSRVPDREDIASAENFYRSLYGNISNHFPSQYKTGALLGCVDVIDCLPQEQYREMYPNGELDDAFVIICDNHRQLTVPFPMRGGQKIFDLEPNIAKAASSLLRQP